MASCHVLQNHFWLVGSASGIVERLRGESDEFFENGLCGGGDASHELFVERAGAGEMTDYV